MYIYHHAEASGLTYLPGREVGTIQVLQPVMDFMTHLTVDVWVATVIAVEHSQSVSLGDLLDCRPISPRRQLPLMTGFFTPGGRLKGNHGNGMDGWF